MSNFQAHRGSCRTETYIARKMPMTGNSTRPPSNNHGRGHSAPAGRKWPVRTDELPGHDMTDRVYRPKHSAPAGRQRPARTDRRRRRKAARERQDCGTVTAGTINKFLQPPSQGNRFSNPEWETASRDHALAVHELWRQGKRRRQSGSRRKRREKDFDKEQRDRFSELMERSQPPMSDIDGSSTNPPSEVE